MFWPRLRLTPEEQKSAAIYEEPGSPRGTLRRFYQGHLELNQTQRLPIWNFQIARRARVFGFTAIGDVHQIRVAFKASSGEEYIVEPQLVSNLLNGWSESGIQQDTLPVPMPGPYKTGTFFYICPFIMEPNIVLSPNQSLQIIGNEVTPYEGVSYRVDFCMHVWEFPGFVDNMKPGTSKPEPT